MFYNIDRWHVAIRQKLSAVPVTLHLKNYGQSYKCPTIKDYNMLHLLENYLGIIQH